MKRRRSPASRASVTLLASASRLLLQLVDALRRFGLRQRVVELLLGLLAQRLQIRSLWTRHRLVAGRPVLRILGGILVGCALRGVLASRAHGILRTNVR